MNEIAERFAKHNIGSIFLYTHEAHPGEHYPHLTSMEQKFRHARDLRDVLKVSRPLLVDALAGACHRSFGSMPTLPWPFNDEESGIVFFEWVAEDTTIILPPGLTEFIFPIDGDYNMMVMATDTNYYDYFRNEEDPLNRFHLDRGMGYFGSMVVQQNILNISRPEIFTL